MSQFADVRYVHSVGVKHQPPRLLSSLFLIASLFLIIMISSFGFLQANRVVGAAVAGVTPSLELPKAPRLTTMAVAPVGGTANITEVIEQWILEHPNHKWSVAIEGLGNGSSSISVGNRAYAPASLYKVLMLPALFDQHGLEELDTVRIEGQSLRSCVEKMLLRSDNPCGEAIANDIVGWGAIDRRLDAAGFHSLALSNPQGMTVTAEDMVGFMADFYAGKLTSKPVRDYVLSLLEHQQLRSGIPAGCQGCKVMNKTADNKIRHDVGIIENGTRRYVLGIFSDGGSYSEIADLTQLIEETINPRR